MSKKLWYQKYIQINDKNVYTCCEEGSFEFGETGPPEWSSSIVSRGEDVKAAIKRFAAERAKKMGKKSINRAPIKKTPVVSELLQRPDVPQLRRKQYQEIFCK